MFHYKFKKCSLVTRGRFLISPSIRLRKPLLQVALRGHSLRALLTTLHFPIPYHITRDSLYLDMIQRMAKVCYTIPVCTLTLRKNNAMHGTLEQSLSPEMHQIPNINKNRWEWVVLCPRWIYIYGRPGRF